MLGYSEQDQISIVWIVDDVAERCQEIGVFLTLDQKREVLRRLERKHDAEIGINWDVIDVKIEEVARESKPQPVVVS